MSGLPVVYVTRGIPPEAMEELKAACEVRLWGEQPLFIPRDALLAGVAGVDAIMCHPPTRIDAEVLDAAGPQLKVVGSMSVGLDHLDLAACRARGVPVGHTPGVLTTAAAEFTIGLLMATTRKLQEGLRAVHDGEWGTRWDDGLWLAGREVAGSTVGVVGLGRIGLAVAARLRAFQPGAILYCGHSPKEHDTQVGAEFVSFENLLERSDMVIATCSVGAENHHLFNGAAFRRMKRSAIFVNVTRGQLVDQDALLEALTSGEILAAGLDVTSPEPLPLDHPLLHLPNCTVTPHLASATVPTRTKMARLTVANILAGLKGQPLPSPAN